MYFQRPEIHDVKTIFDDVDGYLHHPLQTFSLPPFFLKNVEYASLGKPMEREKSQEVVVESPDSLCFRSDPGSFSIKTAVLQREREALMFWLIC